MSSDAPLAGRRIALTGSRKAAETAEYVRRLGGIPLVVPTLSTRAAPASAAETEQITAALDALLSSSPALVIFLTGVGARAVLAAADARGRRTDLPTALARARVVARGPKALGALKGAGIRVDWVPPEATVEAIVGGLDRFEVAGRAVVVQWAGGVDERLRRALEARGARPIELDLYEHLAPADDAPVLGLIDAIGAGTVDFLTFTSAVAARGFFAIAERYDRDEALLAELGRGAAVTVAVGSVTAAALDELGAPAQIVPGTHTTGGMFRAIGQWIAETAARSETNRLICSTD